METYYLISFYSKSNDIRNWAAISNMKRQSVWHFNSTDAPLFIVIFLAAVKLQVVFV